MLTPEALAKIRRLEITSAKLVQEIFSGKYLSVFKGRGLEFSDIRDYQWGDDIRAMHWKAMARFQERAFIKRFTEERQLTVILAVDWSGSHRFGSKGQSKREVLQDIGGLIAYLALKNKDKVGFLAFTDRVELYLPPKSSRTHALRILRELVGFEAKNSQTNLKAALEFLARTVKKRSILFVMSDFLDADYEKPLSVLAKKHDLIAVTIEDPLEASLPPMAARLSLRDLENPDANLDLNLRQRALLQTITESAKEKKENRDALFSAYGIGHLKLTTDGDFVEALTRFFMDREKRALRG